MKRPVTIVVLLLAIVATVADVGFNLVGALRQVEALVVGNAAGAAGAAVPFAPRAEDATVAVPSQAAVLEADHRAQETAPFEPEDEPQLEFESEEALRTAGERDASVAELVNDADPAISNALRDFVTHLDRPGSPGADR